MKFIDLFAGLGGFHVGLSQLGHECVFASEIKPALVDLYKKNFQIDPNEDIRLAKSKDIPDHQILCAGFPCQPFSKAGMQKGLEDEDNGDLFSQIIRILRYHKPKYFILENVQHLAKHDNEETYIFMEKRLKGIGYDVKGEVLSPHDFGIPQHRQRLFIVGCLTGLDDFEWPTKLPLIQDARAVLDTNPTDAIILEAEKAKCLEIWQEFLDVIPASNKLPSFPIWAMEFGATYPYEDQTPHAASERLLGRRLGSFGVPLKGLTREEKFNLLPNYAKVKKKKFPGWKVNYIKNNRAFYEQHKKVLKPVVKKIEQLGVPSWQKFEWNVQGGERRVSDYIIQFRGSGIRLKKPDFFPSLVCVSTQIPIIGWENRYITKMEGARLQGLETLTHFPENTGTCFDALGNAVNAKMVALIAQKLIGHAKPKSINGHAKRSAKDTVKEPLLQ